MMRDSLPFNAAVFAALVVLGAAVSDTLIQRTMPGDPCYYVFLGSTVVLYALMFLLSISYLGVLTMRVVEGRWLGRFPNIGPVHAAGCAMLVFTAMSPFIVLHGPKSSVSYGERVAVTEALAHARSAQRLVERYWRAHQQFPGGIEEAGIRARPESQATAVELLSVTHDGALTLTFGSDRYRNLDARTLVMRPTITEHGLEWDCRGGDLPDHVRPAQCRSEAGCRVFTPAM